MKAEASLFFEQLISHAVAQIQPSQEVLIAGWHHDGIMVRLQVLDIGLSDRVQMLHLRHHGALTLDHAIHHLIDRHAGHHRERFALGRRRSFRR